MATQTAIQIQLDQMGKDYYLEPFTYTKELIIPQKYGNITGDLLIGADADMFVTGVSASVFDKRGNVPLESTNRDQFRITYQNLNTGKNYMNAGVEISELIESTKSIEYRGYMWKKQAQIQFTAQHSPFVQFKRPDSTDFPSGTLIEMNFGRFVFTGDYDIASQSATIMDKYWTKDGATVLTGVTEPYISNQSPFAPYSISLSFNGVKLFPRS
jgi:hypothetical protein